MKITRAQFLEQRHRRFGANNPERMPVPFWEYMVRNGQCAYFARRDFQQSGDEDASPVWCFDRYGMTQTGLSDGRAVCIAGEHEDHYDPDFCIYNDIIIKGLVNEIEILGYPRELFPPTDFHTATLVGDRIILIGSLGYPQDRRSGYTQVFELSLSDFRMTRLETTGAVPGWVSRHTAELGAEGRIIVKGGSVTAAHPQRGRLRKNFDDFSLDLKTGQWDRITSRNWREFLIRLEPRRILSHSVWGSALERVLPVDVANAVLPGRDWDHVELHIEGMQISLTWEHDEIHAVVDGSLVIGADRLLLEQIHRNAEAVLGGSCVLEQLSPEYQLLSSG